MEKAHHDILRLTADVTNVSRTVFLLLLVPDLSFSSTFAHAIAEREVT